MAALTDIRPPFRTASAGLLGVLGLVALLDNAGQKCGSKHSAIFRLAIHFTVLRALSIGLVIGVSHISTCC